jgi:hypothetical protein
MDTHTHTQEELMAPVRQLKAEVERKAVMRLEFEKKDKDPEIVEEGGAFYGDPTGFALNKSVQYLHSHDEPCCIRCGWKCCGCWQWWAVVGGC